MRDEHGGAAGSLGSGELAAVEALAGEQVRGRRPGLQQVVATSRSFTAAGTMLQARTRRLPRSVLTDSR